MIVLDFLEVVNENKNVYVRDYNTNKCLTYYDGKNSISCDYNNSAIVMIDTCQDGFVLYI